MSISRAKFAAGLALLLALAGLVAPPALAQSAAATDAARSAQPAAKLTIIHQWNDPAIATLMLVENLGAPGARAVVVRRPGDMPRNIILVTRETRPADLAQAVSALIASRRSRGDTVTREMRALIGAPPLTEPPADRRPAAAAAGAKATKPRSEPLAASDLQRLAAAPIFEIPGVGRGPALVIRMKATAKASNR